MIRKCEICGKEFETKGGRYPRLYCDEHLYEERECVVCGKTFTVLRYKDQLTCSNQCSNIYYPRHREKKDPVVKICPVCGKEYIGKDTCSKSCGARLQLQRQGSPFGRRDVRKKSKQTMKERYGVPYAQMNECIASKTHRKLSLNNKDNKFEREIKDYIRLLNENIRIISNTKDLLINPNTGYKLELDIYLPEYNLAIECMGRYIHNYNKFPEKEERDKLKVILCKEKGIELIQVWEDNIDEGKQKIKERLLGDK